MNTLYARRGDTFFTHGSGILSSLIRWAETDPEEEKKKEGTWANHTGVVIRDGWMIPPPGASKADLATVVEALGRVEVHAWYAHHGAGVESGDYQVRVFRPIPSYDADEESRFVAEAVKHVGAKYGWWKLLFHLADRACFGGKKVLSALLRIDGRPICSYLGAKVNNRARPIGPYVVADTIGASWWPGFGMGPEAADPDEMMDFCLAHPDFWREIRPEEV